MNHAGNNLSDEAVITTALEYKQYKLVQRLIYRANWSTKDVEHFLYFSINGKSEDLLAGHFGLRNPRSEQFSIECIRSYGGEIYQIMSHDIQVDCSMRFSLGAIAEWGLPPYLALPEFAAARIGARLGQDIDRYLIPIIGEILSLPKLLSLLTSDEGYFPWHATNGAIRAAQIIALAHQTAVPMARVFSALKPYNERIAKSLRGEMDANAYLRRVSADAQEKISV